MELISYLHYKEITLGGIKPDYVFLSHDYSLKYSNFQYAIIFPAVDNSRIEGVNLKGIYDDACIENIKVRYQLNKGTKFF